MRLKSLTHEVDQGKEGRKVVSSVEFPSGLFQQNKKKVRVIKKFYVFVSRNDTLRFTIKTFFLMYTKEYLGEDIVKTVIRLWKKTMNLCTYDSEERDCGVGTDVNDTKPFETLQVVGLTEVARTVIRLWKKTHELVFMW
jgi:hypothetical protein